MMPSKGKKKKKVNKMDSSDKQHPKERVSEKQTLYPADVKRADHVMSVHRTRYGEEWNETLKRMNELCGEKEGEGVSTEVQKKALATWCVEYTDTNFPDIGEVAYAVPTFFVGKHDINMDSKTLAFQHKQASGVRGENAQAKVDCGLRLLNAEMEKNAKMMKGKGKETPTMFIIDNVFYENVLIGLKDIQSGQDLLETFPNPIVKNQRKSSTTGRTETDITIIHEIKGVIIVEVKSFGTHEDDCGDNIKRKVLKQLNQDEKVFSQLFTHHKGTPEVKVCKVFALPNLSKDQATKRCGISDKDDFHLLTKDNLFDDDMECAEAEYNVDKLRAWWDALPDHPISRETIKDIVAWFIGTLSKPRELNSQTERSHARTTADAICLAGKMFKTHGLNLSSDEREALTSRDYSRTHVQGPPGSGRTTMLILKAMNFMKTSLAEAKPSPSKKRHVVVLDIYRGFKGRPIGIQITNAIRDAENGDYKDRVHHLPLNVNEKNEPFSQLVDNLFPGRGKNPAWENVLFIIDEILPLSYWSRILEVLQDKFKVSHVWCADGLIAQELVDAPEFKNLQLEHIYRLPGSVQKVLYHADCDEKRKQQYCSDLGEKQGDNPSASTQQAVQPKKTRASEAGKSGEKQPGESSADTTQGLNVCTHGPTAVCIKHQHHASYKALLDCVQCAEELKDLLMNKMKLVENETHSSPKKSVVGKKAQAATLQAKPDEGHGQAASSDMEVDEEDNPGAVAGPSLFLPCSIVVVFSIPSNLYQASTQGSDHVEINKEDYEYYVAKLNNSQFISTLRKALPVQLFPGTTGPRQEQNQDPDFHDNWDKVLLSWVDIFQGLERDVVIFLPGETAFQTEESAGSSLQVPEMSTMNIRDPPSPVREKKSPASSPRSMSRFNRSQDPQPSTSTEKEVTGRKTAKRPAAAASIHERKIPLPGLALGTSQQPVSSRTRGVVGTSSQDTTPAAAAAATEKGMSSYYWRVRDIQRYTDWDKTSLMFAATRCTSQLIMLVP